jgi:hypothetical protein
MDIGVERVVEAVGERLRRVDKFSPAVAVLKGGVEVLTGGA